jgi:hypothetical protein
MTVATPPPSAQSQHRTRRTHAERLFDDMTAIYQKMDDLYALAKVRQSELDYAE